MPKVRKKKTLADKISGVMEAKKSKEKKPFWKGPEIDGITQSMLGRFLACRERFRVATIEGLVPADKFKKAIEYGNMWHICEEFFAAEKDYTTPLKEYALSLIKRYRESQEEISSCYQICLAQFPVYIKYWSKHPDRKKRVPLLQEESFQIMYTLPSGRKIKLRGKWDSVDYVGKREIWLQENKTKGDIRESTIEKVLTFDIQTGLYVTALIEHLKESGEEKKLKGVRYNVIRRPLSGGRHSIRQHKPTKKNPQGESFEDFYARLGGLIESAPEYFFMRWEVPFPLKDVERFKTRFLDPILEQLCEWYEWVSLCYQQNKSPFEDYVARKIHWQHPYGVYNVMDQGGIDDLDEYLMSGSKVGLEKAATLFPEL